MKRLAPLALLCAALSLTLTPQISEARNACPPGLAKKSPACVPPGQAKKHHRDDRYDRHRVRIGEHLHDRDWRRISDPRRYGLPPEGRDWRYGLLGDQIVRIDRESYEVLELVRALGAVLD